MGKDGEIYLRKPAPWAVREITRSIDKLPTASRNCATAGPAKLTVRHLSPRP